LFLQRAADLYVAGWTLRQIGAELDVHWATVSQHLQRAGVTLRRGGPRAHRASTQQILELRDQGLTWNEVAEQVGMTVSGAWSRYRRAQPPQPTRLGRWQQVFADALDQNLAIGVRAAVADHLGRAPSRAELNAARRAAHSYAAQGRARVFHVPGADADDNAGDRTHLVLAKPNVIMNDIRLRALAVAGSNAAGRQSLHNHAQTARNLRRTLRNAAVGARLIQAEALDSKLAANVATTLADALTELPRLERRLDRRIRHYQIQTAEPSTECAKAKTSTQTAEGINQPGPKARNSSCSP
jgi:predicted DNA-binding transcriptional regulator AlpA